MNGESEFIELVEKMLVRWDYTHTDGRVYAVLLLSEKPLTIDEIASRIGLSRSAVSASLSKLSRDYLVTYTKRGKTKIFKALPNFLILFIRQPHEHLEKEVKPLRKIVEKLSSRNQSFHYILKDLKRLEELLEKILEEIAEFSRQHDIPITPIMTGTH
ncbi:MAG: GbsR/MarR family transcriptional regulator [Thermoprotei archaeon]|nr:ArsR family transcriptional regulator [Thermoproteales archaeon]RLE92133.1 MAG: GbsR/MarR family transcriptional regulator [Thermoprotei archaeon]RLE95855.1 MAG: GbsR/MarR family transcriptional regulator [Thermoprotei archaeon]